MTPAPLKAVQQMAGLRFLMLYEGCAPNFGATGMSADLTALLEKIGLVEVFNYKRLNRTGVTIVRRYRKVMPTPEGCRFASLLRNELRQGNMAQIAGIDDGVGRVAFERDYRERRDAVRGAARKALERWSLHA